MRVKEAMEDPKSYKKEVNAQIRRAEMLVPLRRKKRQYLRLATGIGSRKPVKSARS